MANKKVAGPNRFYPKDVWKKKDEYDVIIGCSETGVKLAQHFALLREKVLLADSDISSLEELSPAYAGWIFKGDITSLDALTELGLEKASQIYVVTSNDAINVFIAQAASKIFKAEKICISLSDEKLKPLIEDTDIRSFSPASFDLETVDKIFLKEEEI